MRGFRDSTGYLCADVGTLPRMLKSFLEQDVQGSVEACQGWLQAIRDVRQGVQAAMSGTGNAHSVELTKEGVVIENIWDETLGSATMSLDTFECALEEWRKFIVKESREPL